MRLSVIALASALALPAAAEDVPPPGALACTGCHALFPGAPNAIHTLSADEIAAALQGFRDGTREATLMPRIAVAFSEAESRAIAEWFAAQEVSR